MANLQRPSLILRLHAGDLFQFMWLQERLSGAAHAQDDHLVGFDREERTVEAAASCLEEKLANFAIDHETVLGGQSTREGRPCRELDGLIVGTQPTGGSPRRLLLVTQPVQETRDVAMHARR